jgi:hypothetical protein
LSVVAAWDILHNCIKRKPPFPPRALTARRSSHMECYPALGRAQHRERWQHRFLFWWEE